jgi:signal transduction histidine kinase
MINVIQKRLVLIFALVIISANVFGMSVLLFYLHISEMSVCKKHLIEDINNEFVPNYLQGGPERIAQIFDEDYFQILTKSGYVIGGSKKSQRFTLRVDEGLLREALAGKRVFQDVKIGSLNYLVSYFPLGEGSIGRAAMSVDIMLEYRNQFLRLVLFSIPGMLIFSYLTSRILVNHALKPAVDFCKFQENFLSNVTHELRSPLASLQGNLEVSLRKERSVQEYKEAITISLKEARRIIDLLKNLHLLASSQLKPLDILHRPVDLERILSALIDRYRPQIDLKNIVLSVKNIPGAVCFCDESLIKRALENLIDNTVKYTPPKGTIKITTSKDPRNIYLTIENTAEDIHADENEYLLEAFYRGKNVANKGLEGKGLGLYITRYILKSHNGNITAAVTPDHMFSVTMSLPSKEG